MKRNKSIRLLSLFACCLLGIATSAVAQIWNPNHTIGTITGKYNFSYAQTPDQLVEIYSAAFPNTGLSYQWESSAMPLSGFAPVSGATSSSYTFSAYLPQTTYYKRKTTYIATGSSIYSNTIKISVVSANWEDINYVREHDVLTTGITSWTDVDGLPIGQKLQNTTYLDGLGRPVEKVSRETATPADPNNLWGDMVQFAQYDAYGKQPISYLPYTTTTESGKYKSSPLSEEPQYYVSKYNEGSAYMSLTFDNSPLYRVTNVKEAGTAWAAGSGKSISYDFNDAPDNVRIFSYDYVQGDAPVVGGVYSSNTLYKTTAIDENGKKVVQYTNKSGQTILKKVQLDDVPSAAHSGWICTYYVYDDFGLLRYELSPEAVNYLDNNAWSFAGTNGQQVLNDLCTQYNYDDKGRLIWKKTPGASAMNMIYDGRDRLAFTQDGNQSAINQWTVTVYDELDRPILSTLYNTTKSISTIKSELASAPAANTIAVTNTANNGGTSVTIDASLCSLTSADLNSSSTTTVLNYLFYDNYSFPNVKSFNTAFTNLSAYSTSDPNVQTIASTTRTRSMATGSKTRVLGGNTFLNATSYYDERGSLIQTLKDNIKTGTDITTLQYHFDGRILSSCTDHTTANTGYTNFKILTKYLFDKLGRVESIQKQFGTNAFKTIASYDFDDVGRIKTKHLDPEFTGGGGSELESLNYSFNIHNQLTGINKDYALKTPGTYDKWGHFFGIYLGYATTDNVFNQGQLNGQISGVVWNTQGDDAQRKYDYTYDNAGRLSKADFTQQQHPGDGWASNKMDFSVNGYTGKIGYDLNGNLLSMLHKGVVPGTTSPIILDDLRYSYASYSNKLQSVNDQMTTTNVNGSFGDFKDGTNGVNPDYVYDNNGNVVIDLNKNAKDLNNVVGANGVHYNFLDKPDQIRITGKGTINIVYSGDGEKLQGIFTPETGTTTTTTYINQFIYQASGSNPDELSYIMFEEGRLRVVTPADQNNGYDLLTVDGNMDLPNGKKGVYDYFLLDYQQNVRMVLSEETHVASNTATMELSRASAEEPLFGQQGAANEVAVTRYNTPTGWTGNTSASISRLGNIAGHNIGPNVLQKVMAGDVVSTNVQYYYNQAASGSNNNFVSNILSVLLQALSGGPTTGIVKGNAADITGQLAIDPGFVDAIQPSTNTGTTPLAYLTVLFFDERFNLVDAADGGVYQQQVAASVDSSGASLNISGVKAPRNGYVYAFISNQSDQDLYFDNLAFTIVQGKIIEENHYYSFGLKIASISSKKYADSYDGDTKNNYQMQGAFAEMDEDIGWNDFALRNYDAQTGRWVQQDPFDQFASPYAGMGNDPANLVDPSGGIGIPCPNSSALSIFLESAVYAAGNTLNAVSRVFDIVGKAAVITQTATVIVNVVETSNVVNGQLTINEVGATQQGVSLLSLESPGDDEGGDDDDWNNLYKADLKRYYQQTHGREGTENDLGDEFEDIFEDYIDNGASPFFKYETRVRRYGGPKFTGGDRNTTPDFIGDVLVLDKRITRIKGSDWFELKQKTGGLYLSSNEDQIRGHINNLKRSTTYAYEKYARYRYQSKLWVVTTADVNFSPGISNHARSNNVLYEHIHAEYRIHRGKWQFRFEKTVSR